MALRLLYRICGSPKNIRPMNRKLAHTHAEPPPLPPRDNGFQRLSNGESSRHFRAILNEVEPIDVIQLACLRQTRTSLFFLTEMAEAGTIYIDRGQIVHAECGLDSGMSALSKILSWGGGEIQEFTKWASAVPTTIGMAWSIALMEASQMQDEASQAVDAVQSHAAA